MKHIKTNLFFIFTLFLFSCSNEDEPNNPINVSARYQDAVFANNMVTRDISYGENTTQGGVTRDLKLDFYEPEEDSATQRPLLVYAFGGGFISGDKSEASLVAPIFARSGYVVAAIDYRIIDMPRTSENVMKAVYDAASDMKAAVRFLRANASTYRIDTDNIFVGGYSAGAIAALQYGYVNDLSEIEAISPSLLAHVNDNGGLEGNSGTPGVSSEIKGVFNFAGALLKADFLDTGEPLLFSVHGTEDEVIPFNSGEADGTGVITEGSNLIHQVAEEVGITHQLITVEGAGHDALFQCFDCLGQMRAFLAEHL